MTTRENMRGERMREIETDKCRQTDRQTDRQRKRVYSFVNGLFQNYEKYRAQEKTRVFILL